MGILWPSICRVYMCVDESMNGNYNNIIHTLTSTPEGTCTHTGHIKWVSWSGSSTSQYLEGEQLIQSCVDITPMLLAVLGSATQTGQGTWPTHLYDCHTHKKT